MSTAESGPTVGAWLVPCLHPGQDRPMVLTRALATYVARNGRVGACADHNRNNASLPRAGD